MPTVRISEEAHAKLNSLALSSKQEKSKILNSLILHNPQSTIEKALKEFLLVAGIHKDYVGNRYQDAINLLK
jgi:hypothetical protein